MLGRMGRKTGGCGKGGQTGGSGEGAASEGVVRMRQLLSFSSSGSGSHVSFSVLGL